MKAPTRQIHSLPIAVSGSGHTRKQLNQVNAVIQTRRLYKKVRLKKLFLVGCSSRSMRLAQHLRGACFVLGASNACLVGENPKLLRLGIAGTRGSMVIQPRPRMTREHPHQGPSALWWLEKKWTNFRARTMRAYHARFRCLELWWGGSPTFLLRKKSQRLRSD